MLLGMIGTAEIIIILAVVLLIFGPTKLPMLGEGIGKMLRGFKREMKALEDDRKPADPPARDEIDVTPAAPTGHAAGGGKDAS